MYCLYSCPKHVLSSVSFVHCLFYEFERLEILPMCRAVSLGKSACAGWVSEVMRAV